MPIPAVSLRRLGQALTWLDKKSLEEVVYTSGLKPDSSESFVISSPQQSESREIKVPSKPKSPFSLPGRKDLETFFREHIIDIVENDERYRALGIDFPSAIALHGPPGCGKTFAVEKLIEYLGWPSFSIDASSVASPYIHETSRKVSEVFAAARKSAPSVLVIDEMEAFLAERDFGSGHHRVEEVAEFLRRIPEAISDHVLIIAMTNRLDMIDEAILRRGRFDHLVEVGPASEVEVRALFDHLLAGLPKDEDIDPGPLAKKLARRPLSDVAFVVREGARLSARAGKDCIGQAELLAALKATPARNEEPERRIGFV